MTDANKAVQWRLNAEGSRYIHEDYRTVDEALERARMYLQAGVIWVTILKVEKAT